MDLNQADILTLASSLQQLLIGILLFCSETIPGTLFHGGFLLIKMGDRGRQVRSLLFNRVYILQLYQSINSHYHVMLHKQIHDYEG